MDHEIKKDHLNGMSYAAIGRKYSIDQRTARRYVLLNLPLSDYEKRPFESKLDPYKETIDEWLSRGSAYAATIHRRLAEEGCECGYTIVNDYVRQRLREMSVPGKSRMPVTEQELTISEKAEQETNERRKEPC